jgi:hypothetical protein
MKLSPPQIAYLIAGVLAYVAVAYGVDRALPGGKPRLFFRSFAAAAVAVALAAAALAAHFNGSRSTFSMVYYRWDQVHDSMGAKYPRELLGLTALTQFIWMTFGYNDDKYDMLTAVSLIFCYGLLCAFAPPGLGAHLKRIFGGQGTAPALQKAQEE